MIDRRAWWSFPLLFAAVAAIVLALGERDEVPAIEPPERSLAIAAPPASGPLRWIVAGGGPSPDLNQVQIEQDLLLARATFASSGPGLTLFAGGPGSQAVQVLDAGTVFEDPLLGRLAALFDPRAGRDARYRESAVPADGPASARAILDALEAAMDDGDDALTVVLVGHGEGGETPRDSHFLTWGPGELWVEDVAAVLDEAAGHRPVRFVVTSCYSGGFAELAFESADPEKGAAADRCGFFATSWDRAASGCDPNPDRGAQEGYGIHFFHALRGEDRTGRRLPTGELDLDGDGAISLLEAHTRARIASRSLDVPVTTSERYLRALSLEEGEGAPAPSVEERAVIERLSARLGLARPEEARERLAWMAGELERLGDELDRIDQALAEVEEELAASLLHRWPVLDDPWHPRFAETLRDERVAIAASLDGSRLTGEREALLAEQADLATEHDRLLVEAAPLERIEQALETVELASRLREEGGSRWERYQALLACERGTLGVGSGEPRRRLRRPLP